MLAAEFHLQLVGDGGGRKKLPRARFIFDAWFYKLLRASLGFQSSAVFFAVSIARP